MLRSDASDGVTNIVYLVRPPEDRLCNPYEEPTLVQALGRARIAALLTDGTLPSTGGHRSPVCRWSDVLALVERAPRKRRTPAATVENESAHDALLRAEAGE